jgi:HSP20 family molecular chaperone IbpA
MLQTTKFKSMFPVWDVWNQSSEEILSDFSLSLSSYKIRGIENGSELRLAVPGISREDLEVKIEGKSLVVSISDDANRDFIPWRKKTFAIPASADYESFETKLQDGILTITVKSEQNSKNKVLKIK